MSRPPSCTTAGSRRSSSRRWSSAASRKTSRSRDRTRPAPRENACTSGNLTDWRVWFTTSGASRHDLGPPGGEMTVRMIRACVVAAILGGLGVIGASALAVAEPAGNVDLNAFRPAMDSRGYLTVNASQVLGDKELSFGLGALDWGHSL